MTQDPIYDSPDVDYDEWVGGALRRGNSWWVAPPRTPLPNMGEDPEPPWVFLGEIDGVTLAASRPRRRGQDSDPQGVSEVTT